MGQRSQIFIRYEYQNKDKEVKKGLVARYFQWNYRERMISRLRYTAEWLQANSKYLPDIRKEGDLVHILETNFNIVDFVRTLNLIDEIKEYQLEDEAYTTDINNDLFWGNDNNDGVLFVDVDIKGNIKYALFDTYREDILMDALGYVAWDFRYEHGNSEKIYKQWEEWIKEYDEDAPTYTANNIKWINENCKLMDKNEVKDFLDYDYSESFA